MPQHKLEIPVFSPSAAGQAAALGAHRIELNAAGSYPVGGLTPSLGELSALLSQLDRSPRISIRIMIRPRGAPAASGTGQPEPDFIYSAPELASMRDAIAAFKASGLLDHRLGDGFVFGALLLHRTTADGGRGGVAVDVPSNSDLVALARPFPCVFHRAFDDLLQGDDDPDRSSCLEDVVACGFAGILTSGGPGIAAGAANVRALRRVVGLAAGRVEVVVGGGVRSGNVGALVGAIDEAYGDTDVAERWFHSSCLAGGGGVGEAGIDRDEAAELLRVLDQADKASASGG